MGGRLSDLSRDDVQRLYGRKRVGGLSAVRVRRIHGALSAALNMAVRCGLVDHNVCKEVNPPSVSALVVRPFDTEEAKRFLAAARGGRFQQLIAIFDSRPILLVVAAIFGLAPDLIIRRLQQQVDKYKDDLQSTQSSQSSEEVPRTTSGQGRSSRTQPA